MIVFFKDIHVLTVIRASAIKEHAHHMKSMKIFIVCIRYILKKIHYFNFRIHSKTEYSTCNYCGNILKFKFIKLFPQNLLF